MKPFAAEKRIRIYRTGSRKEAAAAEYNDVYGWEPNRQPTPPEELFKAIVWSPREDFAVLDEEEWAGAPSAPNRKAVVLDPALKWSGAEFRLRDFVWLDRYRAAGNTHDDCRYSVNLFDGRTGRTSAIREAASPLGYEIQSRGKTILIRKILDNCRSEDDAKAFRPACWLLHPDSLQLTPSPCPDEKR